jgi:hypothetical protein
LTLAAKVLAVDNNFASAEETVAMARQSGGAKPWHGRCPTFARRLTGAYYNGDLILQTHANLIARLPVS